MPSPTKDINTIGSPENLISVGGRLPIRFQASLLAAQELGGAFEKPRPARATVIVDENTNGCHGYRVISGKGYLVSILNSDSGIVQLGPIPMLVESVSADCISLQGYKCMKESLYGSREIDNSLIGLNVLFKGGDVDSCVLARIDTGKNYMYYTERNDIRTKTMNDIEAINSALDACWSRLEAEAEELAPALETLGERLKAYGPLRALRALREKTILAECFLMSIILEVQALDKETYAELALFALNDCLKDEDGRLHDDNIAAYMDLFNLMFHGADYLKPLIYASIHKGDVQEDSINDADAAKVAESVVDEIAYMCAQKIRSYVMNDRFEALDPLELNYFNRIFLKGGRHEWYMNQDIKSILEFLAAEVERKHTDNDNMV